MQMRFNRRRLDVKLPSKPTFEKIKNLLDADNFGSLKHCLTCKHRIYNEKTKTMECELKHIILTDGFYHIACPLYEVKSYPVILLEVADILKHDESFELNI